jgi:transcriptional regulator with XRE-family HTH domain
MQYDYILWLVKKEDIIKKKFGANLRRLRDERDMTQTGLAFEAELEPSHISRIERGVTNTSLTTIVALAGALNVQPSELMKF